MNLFRAEEDVRKWKKFKAGTEDGIFSLSEMVSLFSGNLFKRRMEPDYISNMGPYIEEFVANVTDIGKTKPFWLPMAS